MSEGTYIAYTEQTLVTCTHTMYMIIYLSTCLHCAVSQHWQLSILLKSPRTTLQKASAPAKHCFHVAPLAYVYSNNIYMYI